MIIKNLICVYKIRFKLECYDFVVLNWLDRYQACYNA